MTTKAFRSAAFSWLESWGSANYPTLPIIYENGPVPDEDKIGGLWLDVEVRWYGGTPRAVGERVTRHTGALALTVYAKSASGTSAADGIVDSLISGLGHTRLGNALLYAPQRTVSGRPLGWYRTGVLVPFSLDC